MVTVNNVFKSNDKEKIKEVINKAFVYIVQELSKKK